MKDPGFFIIVAIVIIVNIIKKLKESSQSSKSSNRISSSSGSSNAGGTLDDFLNSFKASSMPAASNEPLIYTEEQVLKVAAAKTAVPNENMFNKMNFNEVSEGPLVDIKKRTELGVSSEISQQSNCGFDLKFSAQNIKNAFIMKEILSPPVALRKKEGDLF
ncbi:MAG: hypothetical protein KAI43_10725 [Candidatus Aureabacteria bacterium]|nr:hypothetical protein [Candidatus Auribacterota bacterium]